MRYSLAFATLLLFFYTVLMYLGIWYSGTDNPRDNLKYAGFGCLVVGFTISVVAYIYNFIPVKEDHFSYDSIVLKRLRSLLVKINKEFSPRGLCF